MLLEQKVNTFFRAGVGLVTAAICLAFTALLVLLLIKGNVKFSPEILAFIAVIALLAVWFGKLSYTLIFRSSQNAPYLLSPHSILCIFGLFAAGALAGVVFRFSSGDLENGFISLLILVLLYPAGHYCWKFAKRQADKPNGT